MPPAENSSSAQLLDFRGPEKKLHGPLLGGQALGNWTHSNWRQRKAGNFVMQSSLLHWCTHRLTCPTARPSLLPLADQGPDAALLAEMPSRTSPARCCCTPSCLLHTRHTSRPSPHSDSANPSCPYYGTAAVAHSLCPRSVLLLSPPTVDLPWPICSGSDSETEICTTP